MNERMLPAKILSQHTLSMEEWEDKVYFKQKLQFPIFSHFNLVRILFADLPVPPAAQGAVGRRGEAGVPKDCSGKKIYIFLNISKIRFPKHFQKPTNKGPGDVRHHLLPRVQRQGQRGKQQI